MTHKPGNIIELPASASRPRPIRQDEHQDEPGLPTYQAEEDERTSSEQDTDKDASPFVSVLTLQLPPGISGKRVAGHVEQIEQRLAELVSEQEARQALYNACESALHSYIEQCLALTPLEALAGMTKKTRAAIERECKKLRRASVTNIMSLVTALNKSHKLGLTQLDKEAAKQGIERQLDGLAEYFITRLINEQRASSAEPRETAEAKAQTLAEYGYVRNGAGLYKVRIVDEQEVLTLIGKIYADVRTKRHIYTVPEVITDAPKEQGVVLVTYLAPLEARQGGQTLEIYRSDMLSRQPKFLEQIQAVVPPHKKALPDFMHLLEVLASVAPIEKRYNATGLIRAEQDKYIFLQPSGGGLADDKGMYEQYQVQFPMQVAKGLTSIKYGWIAPSTPDEQVQDYLNLLRLLDIAPGSKGYGDVLLGIHGFAPMSQLSATGGLWAIIHGGTGSMKSATSRLPLQGYSSLSGRTETSTINLREGVSTPYAIEQALYYLAGMFAHLDDALKGKNVPGKDIDKFYKTLSIIGAHAATKQGGKRGMWAQGEGGFAVEPYPRGSGVYTVEILPDSEGHASELARYIVVSLDGVACVDLALLSALQDAEIAASMNRATASYIMWLLPRMDALLAEVAPREEVYRAQGVHTRTPTNYAKLETGLAALYQYGVSIGALTQEAAEQRLAESRARIVHVALKQKAMMGVDEHTASANSAVTIFYDLFNKALQNKQFYLSDAAYRLVEEYSNGGEKQIIGHRPQPPLFLIDPSEDETGLRPSQEPDRYGWKWNEAARLYEPAPSGQEAGVLKWDGGAEVSLHMYVRDFEKIVYPKLQELASAPGRDIPLPGLHEMLAKLKEQGKLKSTNPTNLHGRASRAARCYVLDMTPDEPSQDESTESQEALDVLTISSIDEDGSYTVTF